MSNEPTTDALEILHRRYYEGRPERLAARRYAHLMTAKARELDWVVNALNDHLHRGHAEWDADWDQHGVLVVRGRGSQELTPFEATAVAEKYQRGQ